MKYNNIITPKYCREQEYIFWINNRIRKRDETRVFTLIDLLILTIAITGYNWNLEYIYIYRIYIYKNSIILINSFIFLFK